MAIKQQQRVIPFHSADALCYLSYCFLSASQRRQIPSLCFLEAAAMMSRTASLHVLFFGEFSNVRDENVFTKDGLWEKNKLHFFHRDKLFFTFTLVRVAYLYAARSALCTTCSLQCWLCCDWDECWTVCFWASHTGNLISWMLIRSLMQVVGEQFNLVAVCVCVYNMKCIL